MSLHAPTPDPSGLPELKTWRTVTHEDYDAMLLEMTRLYRIESAALGVMASMSRRDGEVSSFTLSTYEKLKALDATLQQPEED